MNLLKTLLIGVACVVVTASWANINGDGDKMPQYVEKSIVWVNSLNLNDEAKEQRLIDAIAIHRTAVKKWHDSHSASMVPEGINPRTGEKLSKLDREMIVFSAKPESVHNNLMEALRADLNKEQVEAILDKYTIGKVGFTMKGYHAIVPDLTNEEEAKLRGYLEEAREMAIDYKNMEHISAIFEIYKTKCEQYLNSNGRNWRQLYKDFVKSLHDKKD
jgi:hypothetical protein